jgi:hypothetical protein
VKSISISKGNMMPSAAPGGTTSASTAEAAKAAPDPKPALEIAANRTAGMASAKKSRSKVIIIETL